MMILAVSGYKNSGKSRLCGRLLKIFREKGLLTGYIKRTHESIASPNCTDSGMIRELGVDTLLWGEEAFRYEQSSKMAGDKDVRVVAGKFFPDADIVILEGGKELFLPKVWVLGEREAVPNYPGIFAIYDRYGGGNDKERYGRDEYERLTSDILRMVSKKSARIYIGDETLQLKSFVADFISNSIMGMLDSLKNVPERGYRSDIRIYLKNDMDEM